MNRDRAVICAVALLLTALTYLVFPGHTYLQQDTQIYVPMLEKLADPSLYAHDLLTSRPHMAWTLYDEVTLGLHRVLGLDFRAALTIQQLVFRFLGIVGVYLIVVSLDFTRRFSLFVAALFSLGAMIVGPQVLTFEYEPSPRAFAVPLVFLGIGLLVNGRIGWASVAGAVGTVYHAPSCVPFWVVCLVCGAEAPRKLKLTLHNWQRIAILVAPPVVAAVVLVVCSRLQPGVTERQPLFGILSSQLVELQKLRAAYNWVSLWPGAIWIHYAVMLAIAAGAMSRLRSRLTRTHWIVIGGLLCWAVLSIPISFLTLEVMRWSAMPQFQPARAILFVTAFAVILGPCAAMHAAYQRRYQETFAWMLVAFIVPVHQLITPRPPYTLKEAALILILTAGATGALAVHVMSPRRAAAALGMTALGAFFAIPLLGGVRNYPALWTSEIVDLARWAQNSTERDAVFHFDGAGKDLSAGLFRAEARRAVYVEWKTGGQVNYFEDLALEWWERWQKTMLRTAPNEELAGRGVDYVVVRLGASRPGQHIYANGKYAVYKIR